MFGLANKEWVKRAIRLVAEEVEAYHERKIGIIVENVAMAQADLESASKEVGKLKKLYDQIDLLSKKVDALDKKVTSIKRTKVNVSAIDDICKKYFEKMQKAKTVKKKVSKK